MNMFIKKKNREKNLNMFPAEIEIFKELLCKDLRRCLVAVTP
jgi:hypothetical protein